MYTYLCPYGEPNFACWSRPETPHTQPAGTAATETMSRPIICAPTMSVNRHLRTNPRYLICEHTQDVLVIPETRSVNAEMSAGMDAAATMSRPIICDLCIYVKHIVI